MTLSAQTRPTRLLSWAADNIEDARRALARGEEEEADDRLQDALANLERLEAALNAS